MTDIEKNIALITKSNGRKSIFHFTRAKNLRSITHFDSLWSSHQLLPDAAGKRRSSFTEVFYEGTPITVNAHLSILPAVMETDCSVEEFRAFLDRHVFFWPTWRDCLKMLTTYMQREPAERFAVLELEAGPLLLEHSRSVRLSKYDSGSSPRFPKNCMYKKSPKMFVSLADFGHRTDHAVPIKPSEIKEILIEDQVRFITHFLKSVYVEYPDDVPANWQTFYKPLETFFESKPLMD